VLYSCGTKFAVAVKKSPPVRGISARLQSFVATNGTTMKGHFGPGDKADALDDEHYAALVHDKVSNIELETAQNKGYALRLEAEPLGTPSQVELGNEMTRKEAESQGQRAKS
jgi:hypothetical protein